MLVSGRVGEPFTVSMISTFHELVIFWWMLMDVISYELILWPSFFNTWIFQICKLIMPFDRFFGWNGTNFTHLEGASHACVRSWATAFLNSISPKEKEKEKQKPKNQNFEASHATCNTLSWHRYSWKQPSAVVVPPRPNLRKVPVPSSHSSPTAAAAEFAGAAGVWSLWSNGTNGTDFIDFFTTFVTLQASQSTSKPPPTAHRSTGCKRGQGQRLEEFVDPGMLNKKSWTIQSYKTNICLIHE